MITFYYVMDDVQNPQANKITGPKSPLDKWSLPTAEVKR